MRIRLRHIDCADSGDCRAFAEPLKEQLTSGRYDWPASVFELDDLDTHLAEHRTFRKRAARAQRLGYTVRPIERADHANQIWNVNLSAPERQGRPMTEGYRARPNFKPLPEYPCCHHYIQAYGIFGRRGSLVGYIVLYVVGDLVMVSQILGHATHLANDIMYLLIREALADTLERHGPATVFYNRHDSGTEGLRYFKERLGFRPERVEWV